MVWIQIVAGVLALGLLGLLWLRSGELWQKLLASVGVVGLAVLPFVPADTPIDPQSLTGQQIIDRFHEMFYDSQKTWLVSEWCGINTWQNPNDVWVHQEIISELKPDVIVEAGTYEGGSAVIWALILSQVNPSGRVITIDVKDQVKAARQLPIFKEKVEHLVGSSTDPTIVAEVKKRTEGKKVLVILDSWHKKDHVLEELRAYSSLVPVGSYVIVQDTNINGHPVFKEYGPGPWEAVEEFLKENDQFAPDPSRERMLFTMHPRGYLKRMK
jgi:cephalosporin hydroxylase